MTIHLERALVVLSADECRGLLDRPQVGRVVYTDRALPAVQPVTYLILDDAIVFWTDPAGQLARAARDGVLAFEIDEVDPSTQTGWSVVVTGLPEHVTTSAELSRVRAMLRPWAPGRRDALIRIPLTVVSGRRIVPETRDLATDSASETALDSPLDAGADAAAYSRPRYASTTRGSSSSAEAAPSCAISPVSST